MLLSEQKGVKSPQGTSYDKQMLECKLRRGKQLNKKNSFEGNRKPLPLFDFKGISRSEEVIEGVAITSITGCYILLNNDMIFHGEYILQLSRYLVSGSINQQSNISNKKQLPLLLLH